MSVNPIAVATAMMTRGHQLGLVHFQAVGPAPKSLSIPIVTFGNLPSTPVRAASAHLYNVAAENGDDLQTDNPLVFIQWRFREPGDDGGRAVINRSQAFFDGMHSDTPGVWPGGVRHLWCLRTVTAPAVLDNGHWSKADSYEIRCNPGEYS